MKVRDKGIDFLMFIAVLLVVNSHLDTMYPEKCRFLATGGIFGDALFFFCSGYKLFLGGMGRFDNWYKRRVVRIYPSIIVWDILAALLFSLPLTVSSVFDGWKENGYWFVKCIMLHYLGLYIIRRFLFHYLKMVMFFVCAGALIWWVIAYSPEFAYMMFSAPKFQWYYMFIFTLMGAVLGCSTQGNFRSGMVLLLPLSLVGHYGFLKCVDLFPALTPVRIFALIPMAGVIYGLYIISRTEVVTKIMNMKLAGSMISLCGGLCLEVYISHLCLVTTAYNHLFPINIIVFFILTFLLAYVIRCLSRFVVQTFNKDAPYDYGAIFR